MTYEVSCLRAQNTTPIVLREVPQGVLRGERKMTSRLPALTFACLRHPMEMATVERTGIRPVCHRCHKRMWRWTPTPSAPAGARTAAKISGMAKRGYSREFKPHGDTGKRYLLDQIPAGLWSSVKEKCKRDGISIRALILQLLSEWVGRD